MRSRLKTKNPNSVLGSQSSCALLLASLLGMIPSPLLEKSYAGFELPPILADDGQGTLLKSRNTSSVNFDRVDRNGYSFKSGKMGSHSIDVNICRDHFPNGSAPRQEILTGIDYFSQVRGLDLHLNVGRHEHESIEDRFESIPREGEIKIDYAHNNGSEGYIPCHIPLSTDPATRSDEQWGFIANSCSRYKWGTWGVQGASDEIRASRITVNPLLVYYSEREGSETKKVRYRHFWDAANEPLPHEESSSDSLGYAQSPLFSHELGHSLGMRHTPDWPGSKVFLSTMQSQINTISPFDLAFLKSSYGLTSNQNSAIRKKDLVVSHLVRVDLDPSDEEDYFNLDFGTDSKTTLKRINPLYLYSSGGRYLDCRTQKSPRFHATWFNNGLSDVSASQNLQAEFRMEGIGRNASGTLIPAGSFRLETFILPAMEGLSQHYWSGQLLIQTKTIGVPAEDSPRKTRVEFLLDPVDSLNEASESNNKLAAEVILLHSQQECLASEVQSATNSYLDRSGRISGY